MHAALMTHYEVVGEPYVSLCTEYQNEYSKVIRAYSEFAKSKNADSMNIHKRLYGLSFKRGKQPKGWTKPNRNGFSTPYKTNKEDTAALSALPKLPSSAHIFKGFTDSFNYKRKSEPDSEGHSQILTYRSNQVTWAGDTTILVAPDIEGFANLLQHDKDIEWIEDELLNWRIPEGLQIISDAKAKYIFAKHELDHEAAKT